MQVLSLSNSTSSLSTNKDDETSSISTTQSIASRYSERGNTFQVVIRVRPPLLRELNGDFPFQNVTHINDACKMIHISEHLRTSTNESSVTNNNHNAYAFTFDHVYDINSTQENVYQNTAKNVVNSSLQGYNGTILAYGQTGTGKTYTMEGFNKENGSLEQRGIIPRAIEQIFDYIQCNISVRLRFLVRASYLQIYNETISDLLKPERTNLTIREDKKRGIYVEGLSEWVVRTPQEIYGLMERGSAIRATGSTKMNEISSRSHAVFIVIIEQSKTSYINEEGAEMSLEEFTALLKTKTKEGNGVTPVNCDRAMRQSFIIGKLNLVDLAGSERIRISGATGQRLEESKKINQSLSALGNVIAALTESKQRQHIPYRDSKLTRILENSLGGNCYTTMIGLISPALESITESVSTLKFVNRAKNIKNMAKKNEDLDQKSLLRKYERELKRLKQELETKNQNVIDQRHYLELDAQRKQAEEDKLAVIRELEKKSMEFLQEKEDKRKLEEKIQMLMSQMLSRQSQAQGQGVGGYAKGNNLETFYKAGERGGDMSKLSEVQWYLQEQQNNLRHEYENRLNELEKERETIEEEKIHIERYKQLLLKQRDIMIALTQRLNERDEQIMTLQDEMEIYDNKYKELEEKIDAKTAQIIHLQRIIIEYKENNKELKESKESPINEHLLLTTRQYRPYEDEEAKKKRTDAENRQSRSLTKASDLIHQSQLLTAEEKIKELEAIIANHKSDVHEDISHGSYLNKTIKENKEIKETKKEASEIVTYPKSINQSSQPIEVIWEMNSTNSNNKSSTNQRNSKGEYEQMQHQNEILLKERKALTIILEKKIKTLANGIALASQSVLANRTEEEAHKQANQWLIKEVTALQNLINVSIIALKNADANMQNESH